MSVKRFLSFYRAELKGLLVLVFILLLLYLLRHIYLNSRPVQQFSFSESHLVAATLELDEMPSAATDPAKLSPARGTPVPEYFKFNPNVATDEELRRLGLRKGQVRNIRNFIRSGGRFEKAEDLSRLYTISSDDFKRLKAYVSIPASGIPMFGHHTMRSPHRKIYLPLNSSDSTSLMEISGIGPVLSSRIVRYRERLGGFYSKEQLREVYGIDSIVYSRVSGQLFADSLLIRPLYINRTDFDILRRHPYLKYNLANAIVKYRKQHGSFRNIDDLRKISIMREEILLKIAAYLNFDD